MLLFNIVVFISFHVVSERSIRNITRRRIVLIHSTAISRPKMSYTPGLTSDYLKSINRLVSTKPPA